MEVARDLQLIRRRFAQKPIFFLAILATLTGGLGTFAVVYTAVFKILIEPLPFRDPGDLYMVWGNSPGLEHLMVTGSDIAELRRAGGVIEDAAAFQYGGPTLRASITGDAERIDGVVASANLFKVLGVEPALGRGFTPEDGREGAQDIAVISDGLWKRLGADRSIVGRSLSLTSVPYTVVGVMPPNFAFSGSSSRIKPDIYVPFSPEPTRGVQSNFRAVVRVRQGTSAAQARQAIGIAGSSVGRRDFHRNDRTLIAIGLHEELVSRERPALIALAFTGVFLVLALCVNLASLLLARASEREREFAIARALGARGVGIVRAALLEGLALGLAGGICGAIAGVWGTRILVALGPDTLPRREVVSVDSSVVLVVVTVGVLLGVVAAAMPAWWAARVSMTSNTTVRGGISSGRMRRGLVVVQVGVSLVLLTTGALVVRSFEQLLAADPGFTARGVLTFEVGLPGLIFREDPDAFAFLDRLDTALRAVPGVTAVGATTQLPLSGGGNVADVSLPGESPDAINPEERIVSRIFTRAEYVKAMGLRLREGRGVNPVIQGAAHEVMIDRHVARRLFPDGGAVGATVISEGNPLVVVGVVDQPRLFDLHRDDSTPQIFVRAEEFRGRRPGTYVVRTSGDPRALVPHIRAVVRQIDRRVPVSNIKTMEDIVGARRSTERVSAVLIGALALGALLLVVMGLFGVIAGTVTRRRSELALRIALGATHHRVIRLVVGEGAWLIAAGAFIGVPGVYLAGQTLRGFLIGVSPFDLGTLVGAGAGLSLLSLLACYAAARPVSSIEPNRLLREAV